MKRQAKRILICGAQGTGKSLMSLKFIKLTLASKFEKNYFILCPDDDETLFQKFPVIKPEDLPRSGKIIFDEDDENFFITIKQRAIHGIMVIDDGQFFVSNQKNEQFEKMIQRARQKNLDIIFSCHGMTNVPRRFWTFFTDLILFYTSDSLDIARANIPDIDEKKQWQTEVNNKVKESRNFHYCKTFRLQPSVFDFLNS